MSEPSEQQHRRGLYQAGPSRARGLAYAAGYCLLLAAVVNAFTQIRALGERWFGSLETPAAGVIDATKTGGLHHVLAALGVIIMLTRGLGAVCLRFGQPAVIGEVVAGILLGPSVLGSLWPEAQAQLLPAAVLGQLSALAQLGVVLYMFLVGLELDLQLLRSRSRATMSISHASIALPFLLGAALALWIYPELAPPGSSFGIFAMFIGVSMSVTAFPVLARILRDRGLSRSELGTIALGSAAVDDVTAWCLLALIVSATRASSGAAVLALGGVIAFGMFMLLVVEPRVRQVLGRRLRQPRVSHSALALSFVGVFACAWVTEAIGVHAVFGAFLAGAVIPHDSALARALARQLEDVVLVLLLPPFFALTGARTELGLLSGSGAWLTCAAIIGVACLGKLGGSAFVARLCGARWRDAWMLGALLNTRGLVELIVLSVGLELGVLSKPLFAMLVLMALVTTFMTAPLLRFLERGEQREASV